VPEGGMTDLLRAPSASGVAPAWRSRHAARRGRC
jgi:hypothetical protein